MKLTREEFNTAIKESVVGELAPLREENVQLRTELESLRNEQTNFAQRIIASSSTAEQDGEKGMTFTRIVRALAIGKGDVDKAVIVARQIWPDREEVAKALMASDLEAGGVLIAPEFSQDLIELLRPASVVRSLNPTMAPMDRGTVTIPKLTGGATAAYSGENLNIQPSEPTTGQLVLTAKKLTALVPISNDLLRRSSPSADTMVRDDLVNALAERSDLAWISGDGANHTPRGLRNWALAANVIPSASADSSPTVAEIVTDLGALRLALRSANVPFRRPGYIMSPRTEQVLRDAKDANSNFLYRSEMNAGRLEGFPFQVTTQVSETLGAMNDESELYFADFADVIIAETESIIIDASPNAAYWDGTQLQAAFSRDQTVIRAIMEHDMGLRHDESVAVIPDLLWAIAP